MNTTEYLVTLNVPPSLEESLVDCLLTFESNDGFSSLKVNAHDYDHKNKNLSIAEQVSGQQKKIRFQMYVPETQLQPLLDKLKHQYTDSGVHYWVMPIIESGYL